MGAKGGLLAVIDRVDAEADSIAARLSATIPVALIDRLTCRALAVSAPLALGRRRYLL